jgi:hypothetical protein
VLFQLPSKTLRALTIYFQKWKIKMTDSKTEAILFYVRRQPSPPILQAHSGIPIHWSQHVTYLGLVLDTKLCKVETPH